jgi:hypothetical protein
VAKLRVAWSKHIEDKLNKELSRYGITKELIEEIVRNPDELMFDSENSRNVAVRLKHNLAVIYELREADMFIITAIYSSNLSNVVLRRKRSGRWL